MASDATEDSQPSSSKSKIRALIKTMEELLKNPSKSKVELNTVLDSYLGELNEKQVYLSNGIANVNFPQAGMFIQTAVDVLSKKIDQLWDENLEFHMKLCAQSKNSEEKEQEEEKIIERINQKKRKKIVNQNKDINSHLNHDLSNLLNKANDTLKKCAQIRSSKSLEDAWKAASSAETSTNLPSNNVQLTKPIDVNSISDVRLCLNSSIYDVKSKEKIFNYKDVHLTTATCDGDRNWAHDDQHLQDYLNEKHMTYAEFWIIKHGADFETFKKAACKHTIFNNASTSEVNYTENTVPRVESQRVGDELMNTFLQNSVNSVDECNNSVAKEKPKRSMGQSECISDADSLFYDGPFEVSDDEGEPNNPNSNISKKRISMADSGVFSNIDCTPRVDELSMLVDENNTTVPDKAQACDASLPPTLERISEAPCKEEFEIFELPPVLKKEVNCNVTRELISNARETQRKQKDPDINDKTSSRLKRKLETNEEDIIPKRRKPRFKWLKTTTVILRDFERFYRRHYEPDFGEDDLALLEWDDDFDTAIPISEGEDSGTCHLDACDSLSFDGRSLICDNISDLQTSNFPSVSPDSSTSIIVPIPEDDNCVRSSTPFPQVSNREKENSIRLKAVSEWRKHIEPKLLEDEKKIEFDIHKYGTNIMDSFSESEQVPFKNIVQGKAKSEIVRDFLATLHLANTENIEIISRIPGVIANDSLELKLLTRERYHERLNEYTAPSTNFVRERMAEIQALRPNSSSTSRNVRPNSSSSSRNVRPNSSSSSRNVAHPSKRKKRS